ncbi:MAG: aryl-sulfate sulfotransferase [Bacteroidia bacterium]
MLRYLLILFTIILCFDAQSKNYPQNNQVIKHLQVMYETDVHENADAYEFYVFNKNKLIDYAKTQHPVYLGKTILDFGSNYKLKVKKLKQKEILNEYSITFKTAQSKRAGNEFSRIEITKYDSVKTLNGLIFMDNNFIVNRRGKPVYCIDTSIAFVRNFHITNTGTLFYLDSTVLIETNLNGKVLWRSPNIDNNEFKVLEYHHDMLKTRKGTYLCIASVKYKNIKQKVKYNVLIELDRNNNIKWIWHEKDFFPNDSIVFKATHINSLFYDEDNEEIYTSNRDLHTILKIDKKTGKLIWSFGYQFNDVPYVENNIVKMQHRVIKLPNNNLLVFNNDSGDGSTARTSVVEISNPGNEGNAAEIIWSYRFNFDSEVENFIPRMGGAVKLKNGNYLIASGIFDRNFEITKDGEIVWELRMEQYNQYAKQFAGAPCYRSNFATSLYPYYYILYKKQSKYVIYNAGTENIWISLKFKSGKTQNLNLKSSNQIELNEKPIGVIRLFK